MEEDAGIGRFSHAVYHVCFRFSAFLLLLSEQHRPGVVTHTCGSSLRGDEAGVTLEPRNWGQPRPHNKTTSPQVLGEVNSKWPCQ